MSIDWAGQRTPLIRAVRDGALDAVGTEVQTTALGPRTFDRIAYPYLEILPESSDRQQGNEWVHQIRLNCYFETERDRTGTATGESYLDHLATAMDAVSGAMAALSAEPAAVSYAPTLVEDFAGEADESLLVLISTRLTVTTLVDLAES